MLPSKILKSRVNSPFRGIYGQIYCAVGLCSLGTVLVASSEQGVCAIALGDNPMCLIKDLLLKFPHAELTENNHYLQQMLTKVIAFIETPCIGLSVELDLRGTVFQHRVWRTLQAIPCGTTLTYTELAKRIGQPKAVRAVASACAANILALVIPCHRVLRADGSCSDYRWGIARKVELLRREKLQCCV